MNLLILESMMLDIKEDQAIYSFFNNATGKRFYDVVQYLSNKVGVGLEGFVNCSFPEEQEPWEEKFEGVLFQYEYGKSIIVDYSTFFYYYRIACKNSPLYQTVERKNLDECIEKVKNNYQINVEEINAWLPESKSGGIIYGHREIPPKGRYD